jgi:methylenetetrahydrofolate reductase (NADPH)
MFGRLRSAITDHRFAVTTEIGPPRGADVEAIRRKARLLRDWVDAANITDNQGATVRMASWGASIIALEEGLEPVMQLQCRDRNRLALQSDLIAAAAVGIPNIVLMTGDQPKVGDHPDAPGVFDLDSLGLIATARKIRDEGRLISGRELKPPPQWFIGAVEDPFAPGQEQAGRFGKKIEAGSEFVQTQYVFEVSRFETWMAKAKELGYADRCAVLAGVGPIRSLGMLDRLKQIPGVYVPEQLERRLRAVPEDKVGAESIAICAEIIRALREVPGVAGVHVMAVGLEEAIPEIVERAGLGRRVVPLLREGR